MPELKELKTHQKKLIEEHLPLIKKKIKSKLYKKRQMYSVDLLNEILSYVVEASQKFDSSLSKDFANFASYYCMREYLDYLDDNYQRFKFYKNSELTRDIHKYLHRNNLEITKENILEILPKFVKNPSKFVRYNSIDTIIKDTKECQQIDLEDKYLPYVADNNLDNIDWNDTVEFANREIFILFPDVGSERIKIKNKICRSLIQNHILPSKDDDNYKTVSQIAIENNRSDVFVYELLKGEKIQKFIRKLVCIE